MGTDTIFIYLGLTQQECEKIIHEIDHRTFPYTEEKEKEHSIIRSHRKLMIKSNPPMIQLHSLMLTCQCVYMYATASFRTEQSHAWVLEIHVGIRYHSVKKKWNKKIQNYASSCLHKQCKIFPEYSETSEFMRVETQHEKKLVARYLRQRTPFCNNKNLLALVQIICDYLFYLV